MDSVRTLRRPAKLEDDLIPVDAVGRRWNAWGRERYPLHPLEAIELLHDGAVLGGGPQDMPDDVRAWDELLADEAVPVKQRTLLRVWYSNLGTPTAVIAQRVNISRSVLYERWKQSLWFMKAALRARGLKL